jgi:chromosome segregation ATPase
MTKIERESINFKLPKPLTAALREKARQLNTTATDLVIQGLHHVLGKAYDGVDDSKQDFQDLITRIEALEKQGIESSIENRLDQLETQLNYLESRIDRRGENGVKDIEPLEEKLEALTMRIAQLEGAISILGQRQQTTPTRRQAFTYHPPQMELKPFTEENLAKRLAASALTIRNHRETKSPKEFESWCRQRDPGGLAWRYQKDGLYQPIK